MCSGIAGAAQLSFSHGRIHENGGFPLTLLPFQARQLGTRNYEYAAAMDELFIDTDVRQSAAAGLFYPKDAAVLRNLVEGLLAAADPPSLPSLPKVLIVPHAGYPSSGQVAAAAYSLLRPMRSQIERVVLLGASHRVYLPGIALPQTKAFATPLGQIAIDQPSRDRLLRCGDVLASNTPHDLEYCLEVQLPFLQAALDDFILLPLIVGSTPVEKVVQVLTAVWGGPETLVLASSDEILGLAADATREDTGLIDIDYFEVTRHTGSAAGIAGLLSVARQLGLQRVKVARQDPAESANEFHRFGYGAYALHDAQRRTS
jgi:MEMO1 family protein